MVIILHSILKNLHQAEKIYTGAACGACNKYQLCVYIYIGEQAIGNMGLENFGMPMKSGWRMARQEFDDEEGYGVFRLVV